MKTEFRKATRKEDKLIRSAIYKLYREKLQHFIGMVSLGIASLCVLFLGFLSLNSIPKFETVLGIDLLVYIIFCLYSYMIAISLGYRMYRRKMVRLLEGGFQVLTAPMVSCKVCSDGIDRKMTIGITVDSDELEEDTIMPVTKKETITTKVGKKQLNAYTTGAQAILVKYNLGEGFWDKCDCIPMEF